VFFLGWSLLGAAFKPKASARLGIAVAAILYVAVGIAYFLIRFQVLGRLEIIPRLGLKLVLFLVMRWPLTIVLDALG
jgi:hypothetical protein